MKTILYTTDYSKNSVTALQYAYYISKNIKARLEVIHVFNFPTTLYDMANNATSEFGLNYFKRHTDKLNQFCYDHLGVNLINISVRAVENKSVLEGIISTAKEIDPLFIVVGTKGMGTLKDLIMGNTTKNLIEKRLFPVLSIPYKEKFLDLKTFVYATAFEEDDIHAICKLSDIAMPLNAMIKVVHVSSSNDYPGNIKMEWFKEMLSEKMEYNNIEFEVLTSNNVFNSIKQYADDVEADLIAMLERKKGGVLKNFITKDTVNKMNEYGKYPLISFSISNCIKLSLN